MRQPDRPARSAAGGGSFDNAPDPWGVRRAENLLTSLEGVLSARVVTTPLGEVSEVHVLAQAGLQPKQLVRNIESALLAQLGLKVDHRKISIAQTAEVRPHRGAGEGRGAGPGDAAGGAVRVAVRGAGQAAAPGEPSRCRSRFSGRTEHGGGGGERHPAEQGGGGGAGGGHGAGPAAVGPLGGARGRQDRGGLRPASSCSWRCRGWAGREAVLLIGTRGDQGERGAGGGVCGAGCDQPLGGGPAAHIAKGKTAAALVSAGRSSGG